MSTNTNNIFVQTTDDSVVEIPHWLAHLSIYLEPIITLSPPNTKENPYKLKGIVCITKRMIKDIAKFGRRHIYDWIPGDPNNIDYNALFAEVTPNRALPREDRVQLNSLNEDYLLVLAEAAFELHYDKLVVLLGQYFNQKSQASKDKFFHSMTDFLFARDSLIEAEQAEMNNRPQPRCRRPQMSVATTIGFAYANALNDLRRDAIEVQAARANRRRTSTMTQTTPEQTTRDSALNSNNASNAASGEATDTPLTTNVAEQTQSSNEAPSQSADSSVNSGPDATTTLANTNANPALSSGTSGNASANAGSNNEPPPPRVQANEEDIREMMKVLNMVEKFWKQFAEAKEEKRARARAANRTGAKAAAAAAAAGLLQVPPEAVRDAAAISQRMQPMLNNIFDRHAVSDSDSGEDDERPVQGPLIPLIARLNKYDARLK